LRTFSAEAASSQEGDIQGALEARLQGSSRNPAKESDSVVICAALLILFYLFDQIKASSGQNTKIFF
jgi:hypothetical protein